MSISDILAKTSPILNKRKIPNSDYEKLIEANKNLVDEIKYLKHMIEVLEKEKNKYKDRINKAIEFIEDHNIIGTNKDYLPSEIEKCYSLELIETLGGSNESKEN